MCWRGTGGLGELGRGGGERVGGWGWIVDGFYWGLLLFKFYEDIFPLIQRLQLDVMSARRIVYTLGSLQQINLNILQKPQQKVPEDDQPTLPTYPQLPTTQPISKQLPHQNPPNSSPSVPPSLKKHKLIKKPAKGKQLKEEGKGQGKGEANGNKGAIMFRFFRRKLGGKEKKLENGKDNLRGFDLVRIMDWLMEASQNLHLSKDTFYTAISICIKFYQIPRNQLFNPQIMQTQVAGILSLAAKLDSNKINYSQVISTVCGLPKPEIINCQIYVMKAIGFLVPTVRVYEVLVGVCLEWDRWRRGVQGKDTGKGRGYGRGMRELGGLEFGDGVVGGWSDDGKANLGRLFAIFDMIALRLYRSVDYRAEQDLKNLSLQALFLLMNHEARQFFPLKPTHKTQSIMIYENFMKDRLGYKLNDFNEWLTEMIKNQQKLHLNQKISNYLNTKPTNPNPSTKTTHSDMFGQGDHFLQVYDKNILN